MKFNLQGLKDNLAHMAGIIVGLTALRITGLRYNKDARGTKWFSTVSANLAADGDVYSLAPFVIFYK